MIPRLTWTPIEPILRASPSGGGSAPRPDPGQALDRLRLDPVRAERADRHPLQPPHVLVDVVAVGAQGDDRVDDQLPGAVVGDAPAAVGVVDLDPLQLVPLRGHRQLRGLGAAPARVDGRVLEQQQHVGDLPLPARLQQPALGRGGLS